MNEAAEVDEVVRRKPGRPPKSGLSDADRAELEELRREKEQRAIAAEKEAREDARRDAQGKAEQAKREATKTYINVSRGRLYTGVETLTVGGSKVKTMGILFPRDWVGDILPRHGAKKMELTQAQAEGFGEKLVALA